jgi:tetratricopeptide (TPR) repeat protein
MTDQNLSALIQKGQQHLNTGDFHGAIACFEQAAAQARAWGEGENELVALGWLPAAWGSVAEHQREIEAATRLLTRARELRREDYELGATLRLSEAIADLDLRGHWHEIKPLLLQGIETSQRLNKPWYEAYHRMLLGTYAARMKAGDEAQAWVQQTLNALTPELERNTVPRCLFRMNCYSALSLLMIHKGNYSEALRYAEMTLGLAQDEGNPPFIAEAQLIVARAHIANGQHDQARLLVEAVLPAAREQQWKVREQEAEYLLSEIERHSSQPDAAEVPARRALELARQMQRKEEEVQGLISLGKALLAQHRKTDAQEVLAQARRLAQERDYADYFGEIEALG